MSDTTAQGLQQHSVRSWHAAQQYAIDTIAIGQEPAQMIHTMVMLHLLQRVQLACANEVQRLLLLLCYNAVCCIKTQS